jgi:hypothetical protein
MEKKKLDEGKVSNMTPERIQLLEGIDFKWGEVKGQAAWEKRYSELVAFKNKVWPMVISIFCRSSLQE